MTEQRAPRWVIHADLDAFFAAAEVLRRPELAGLPLIVGGAAAGRGVVSSASYEARVFGVRSAMPTAQALRLCPQAVVLPPDGRYYGELSRAFRAVLDDCSPLVEMMSVDEAYLDATGCERWFEDGAAGLARDLKRRVRAELGLAVSLGVAANKLVAKIASDLDKPDGLRIVARGQEAATLAPLPVERLPGVGPKATARLRANGLTTVGDVQRAPHGLLASIAGRDGDWLRRMARGEDDRPVRGHAERERKSVGHEHTFSRDRASLEQLVEPLYRLAEETGAELRRRNLAGTTVALKLRYHDFSTITRQASLPRPTDAHQEIFSIARNLLAGALRERNAPVRLIGVRVSSLSEPALQLALFDSRAERTRRLNAALDQIAAHTGERAVTPARYVRGDEVTGDR